MTAPLDASTFTEGFVAAPEEVREPFSLESLIAWLETKPADEPYCYNSNGHCLWAQYLRDTGIAKRPNVGPDEWNDCAPGAINHLLPGARHRGDYDGWGNVIAKTEPRAFGAALSRARALLAERSR